MLSQGDCLLSSYLCFLFVMFCIRYDRYFMVIYCIYFHNFIDFLERDMEIF